MIRYCPDTHSLSLPYGDLVLTDIPEAIVARLVLGAGSCVTYAALAEAAWPDYHREVNQVMGRRNIRSQLHQIHCLARALGATCLFANVRGLGFSWAPT